MKIANAFYKDSVTGRFIRPGEIYMEQQPEQKDEKTPEQPEQKENEETSKQIKKK